MTILTSFNKCSQPILPPYAKRTPIPRAHTQAHASACSPFTNVPQRVIYACRYWWYMVAAPYVSCALACTRGFGLWA